MILLPFLYANPLTALTSPVSIALRNSVSVFSPSPFIIKSTELVSLNISSSINVGCMPPSRVMILGFIFLAVSTMASASGRGRLWQRLLHNEACILLSLPQSLCARPPWSLHHISVPRAQHLLQLRQDTPWKGAPISLQLQPPLHEMGVL